MSLPALKILEHLHFRVLRSVLKAVEKLQTEYQGLRGHVKEILKSSTITGEIARHHKNIQGLCSKLKVARSIHSENVF
jgi:hypothetical protein